MSWSLACLPCRGTDRDRLVELAAFHGLLTGTLGEACLDLSLMMQTEVAEVAEAVEEGRGGSSTMPHKKNPVETAAILAAAYRAPGLVSTMFAAMLQENERGLGGWHAAWETLPTLCQLTLGALGNFAAILDGLQVFPAAMLRHLNLTEGLMMAGSVSMGLAAHVGRAKAHATLEAVVQTVRDNRRPLREALAETADVTQHLHPQDLDRCWTQRVTWAKRACGSHVCCCRRRERPASSMPFLELGTHRLLYEFEPHGTRPVLLLANSLGTDASLWGHQRGRFAMHFDVLRYDGRGQGQSSVPGGPYSLQELGTDVLALLDHLRVDRVCFCGISLGGMTGQWLAAHHGARLSRLVMSNTAARIGTREGWNSRIATVERDGMQGIVPAVPRNWFTANFIAAHPDEVERIARILRNTSAAGYAACCALACR